jgi:aldose 1-epimerase
MVDVILGFDNINDYMTKASDFGASIGRYANRIAGGTFELDGQKVVLNQNDGENCLHGGAEGWQYQVYEAEQVDPQTLKLTMVDPDGHMGFPGTVTAVVTYKLTDDNAIDITYSGTTNKPTVLSMTNHAYFNLNGEGNGNILGHVLRLNASEYLPTTDSLIPLGESAPVAGTPMDFVNEKVIGAEIKADFPALNFGKGYDNCWVIDGAEPGQIQEAAYLYAPESGRTLTMYTTQPGVQVYTGNWLSGCPAGKNGHTYEDYEGVAIECQNYPDAPNQPDYPSAVLRPGEVYEQAIIFAFGIR